MTNLNAEKDKLIYRKLVSVATPIALQGVVSATLGFVDNLMVGALGEAELAAVGIATQIFFVHYLVMVGFASGTATFFAQFFGTKDFTNIRRCLGFLVSVTMAVSVIFFIPTCFFPEKVAGIFTDKGHIIELASSYIKIGSYTLFMLAFSVPIEFVLKATQQTKIPMVVSTVVFSTNTFLNWCLIFGNLGLPKLGVAGAATATLIARFAEIFINLLVIKRNVLKGPLKEFLSYDKDLAKRIMKNAIPTVANETLWSLGQTMYVVAFARIGVTSYAAYQAAAAVQSIFTFIGFSVGDAALILIGEKLGQGDKEEAYYLSKKIVKAGIIVGLALGLLMVVTAHPLMSLFNISVLGKSFGTKILIVYGVTTWMSLYTGIHTTGTLRGGGDTKFAAINEILCVWLIAVPLAFIGSLVLHLPIYWVVLMVRFEDVVKGIVLTKRFLSKKWMNNMIEEI
ncbi:MAG: MATE family efflux transporter [Clostridia bacterium]|nr:MATE family efflux transporter [Clostridia bacterium]